MKKIKVLLIMLVAYLAMTTLQSCSSTRYCKGINPKWIGKPGKY